MTYMTGKKTLAVVNKETLKMLGYIDDQLYEVKHAKTGMEHKE